MIDDQSPPGAWKQHFAKMPRSNKYKAKKTACAQGHLHDSKREAKRCDELRLLQRAGKIEGLTIQPRFEFVVNGSKVKMGNGQFARYTPDFEYMENGQLVAEDTKGFKTEAFALRAALFRHCFPHIELRVTK